MRKTVKAVASKGQTDAQIATLAQQAMQPPTLPDPENANIVDRIKMNDASERKRLGRNATLAGGAYGKPATVKTIAMGGG